MDICVLEIVLKLRYVVVWKWVILGEEIFCVVVFILYIEVGYFNLNLNFSNKSKFDVEVDVLVVGFGLLGCIFVRKFYEKGWSIYMIDVGV